MAKDDVTTVPSGFRPYSAQGFQIQAPNNYWQGGNFFMPGISQASPVMTSSIMDRFPGLASVMKSASPPPSYSGMAQIPFVGAPMQSPLQSPLTPSSVTPQRRVKRGKGFMGLLGNPDDQ